MDRPSTHASRHSRRRSSNTSPSQPPSDQDSRATKRPRLGDSDTTSTSNIQTQSEDDSSTELVDLREGDEGSTALAKTLSKQREDAIRAQQEAEHEKGRSLLTAFRCPICIEPPVDATTTVCGMFWLSFWAVCELVMLTSLSLGHLFCHKCIIDALKPPDGQRTESSSKLIRRPCPVCRKPLSRVDASGPRRNLVPIQLKLATKKRDQAAAGGA